MSVTRRAGGALAAAHLAELRDAATGPAGVRRALAALGTLVVAEALRDLETVPGGARTPIAPARVERLARRVTLAPVLRAGLALVEPALALLPPDTRVAMIGLTRDERTLRPRRYLESLPAGLAGDEVLVLEVMLATGGSAVAALDLLAAHGAERLRVAAVIAAPEGLGALARAHPGVPVTVAAVDERLDARGFIVPGMGDAGDRLYGTG